MTTGERIKELRISHNMTLDELGEKLGIQKSAVHKYECGIVTNLKRSTIMKLAEIFNVSPMYIMGIDQENSENDEELALDNAYLRLARDAKREGISPDDIRLAIKTIKMLRERDNDEA